MRYRNVMTQSLLNCFIVESRNKKGYYCKSFFLFLFGERIHWKITNSFLIGRIYVLSRARRFHNVDSMLKVLRIFEGSCGQLTKTNTSGEVCVCVWERERESMWVCVYVCVCVCVCVFCVCERERERVSEYLCMCVCVREREIISEYVCMCVCERERETILCLCVHSVWESEIK